MVSKQIFIKLTHGKTDVIDLKRKIKSHILKDILKKKYDLQGEFFLIRKSKVLKNIDNINYGDEILLNKRLKGGFLNEVLTLLSSGVKLMTGTVSLVESIMDIIIRLVDLITYVFNPVKLFNGLITGVLEGLKILIIGPINDLSGGPKKQTIKKKNRESKNKKYCFKTRFLKILILILCPPLAIFIDRGIKGIVPVIISIILTFYLYYFPGLIFSSLYLLN